MLVMFNDQTLVVDFAIVVQPSKFILLTRQIR